MEESESKLRERFTRLTYAGFRNLAREEGLSEHQRIGFPDSMRAGYGPAILNDIRAKLPRFDQQGALVLDIGPGCGELASLLIDHCERMQQELILVDSEEMLARLPDRSFITKIPGPFPQCCHQLAGFTGRIDAALAYSVLQYVFVEGSVFAFLDAALDLLCPGGGAMLIGDIPNASMRKRFLASAAGGAYHRQYTGRDEDPPVAFNVPADGEIDDAAISALLLRARAAGTDAWVMPQAAGLPMGNRREDILLRRP